MYCFFTGVQTSTIKNNHKHKPNEDVILLEKTKKTITIKVRSSK